MSKGAIRMRLFHIGLLPDGYGTDEQGIFFTYFSEERAAFAAEEYLKKYGEEIRTKGPVPNSTLWWDFNLPHE